MKKQLKIRRQKAISNFAFDSESEILISDDGKFEYHKDGTLHRYIGSDSDIIIPSVINGTTIKSIEKGFANRKSRYSNTYLLGNIIKSISIPSTVTNIEIDSLGLLNRPSTVFQKIIVDNNNPAYCSEDGVLYNKDKTVLLAYPICKNGTSFVIPNTVTTIENYAFQECNNLHTVLMQNSVTSIKDRAFALSSIANLTLPETISEIGSGAFAECDKLSNFSINNKNNYYEFSNGIIYKTGKTYMVELLPYYETENYYVPENIKTIGISAFSGCDKIVYLKIPNTVTLIERAAFSYCNGIRKVDFPDNITTIPPAAFYGCALNYSYEIPKNMTALGDDAFFSSRLSDITIPSNIKNISNSCFFGCSNLRNVTVENGVESIGRYAFSYCNNLSSITAYPSLTSIDNYAFESASNSVTFYGYLGSTIEKFANDYNYNFISIGDSKYSTATKVSDVKTDRTVSLADDDTKEQFQLPDITSSKVPADIPFLEGNGFSLDLSLINVEVAREIDSENKCTKFSVGIGVEKSAYELDDDLNGKVNKSVFENHIKLKNFVDKLSKDKNKDEIKKNIDKFAEDGYKFLSKGNKNILGEKFSSSKSLSVDFSVFGYMDIVRGYDGSFKSAGGKLVVAVTGKASASHQLIIGVVPIVIKGEISATIKTNIGLRINFEHEDKPIVDFEGGLELTLPAAKIPAGVGVGCLADISVYGGFENIFKYDYSMASNGLTCKIAGEAGLSVTLLFFEKEWPIIKGEIQYYPRNDKDDNNSVSAMIESDDWEMSVGSSENNQDWNYNSSDLSEVGTLQKNVYKNAKPKLISSNDTTMLVWCQSDTTNRTVGNHTEVVYSIYDKNNGTWSAPKIVSDDGTADFYPAIATDGKEIYVTWANANKKFNANSDISEVTKSCEINVAKYNFEKDCFENVKRLTNNNLFDTIPEISVIDGKAVVVWKSNSSNSTTSFKGSDSVYYAVENSSGNYSINKLVETPNLVSSIVTDGKNIAYLAQTDSNASTTDDIELFAAPLGGTASKITSTNIAKTNLAVSKINGESYITYAENGAIFGTKNLKTQEKLSADNVYITKYQFVSN